MELAITRSFERQLLNSGVDGEKAGAYRSLLNNFVKITANRMSLSPECLYLKMGLQVRSVKDDVVSQAQTAGYQGADLVGGDEWLRASECGLDMSHSARMQRARLQGFQVDSSETWYHGTDTDFPAFDTSLHSGRSLWGDAAYLTSSKQDVSQTYASGNSFESMAKAEAGARTTEGRFDSSRYREIRQQQADSPYSVMPVFIKSTMNVLHITPNSLYPPNFFCDMDEDSKAKVLALLAGPERDFGMAERRLTGKLCRMAQVESTDAIDQYLMQVGVKGNDLKAFYLACGFDAAMIDMSARSESLFPKDTLHMVVFEPGSNIRSVNAAFDPSFADSNLLLAQSAWQGDLLTDSYPVFDDEVISTEQAEMDRGLIQFGDVETLIRLFQEADSSTVIHEMGHLYLQTWVDACEMGIADDALAGDMKTICRWLGVENYSEIGPPQHEMFARGLERYMLEGKLPAAEPEVKSMLDQVKGWMVEVYDCFFDLGTELNPDVRSVFDRMVSGSEIPLSSDDAMEVSGMINPPRNLQIGM